MTFSLVARCAKTGMLGTAIASSSPAVAARCSYTRSATGAVSSQNITDPMLGPYCLDQLQSGLNAIDTVSAMRQSAKHLDFRQVLIIDKLGGTAIHSGSHSLGIWNQAEGIDVASGGNLLANPEVPQAIVDAFEVSKGHIGDRLLTAMQAGLSAGGEAGPIHSAGMQIVDNVAWPVADLRCDWTEACPIEKITNAWEIYKPQLQDYIQRALDPSAAPTYGVPGNE